MLYKKIAIRFSNWPLNVVHSFFFFFLILNIHVTLAHCFTPILGSFPVKIRKHQILIE